MTFKDHSRSLEMTLIELSACIRFPSSCQLYLSRAISEIALILFMNPLYVTLNVCTFESNKIVDVLRRT